MIGSLCRRAGAGALAALWLVAAGCGDSKPLVQIADVDDGAYLAGAQTFTFEVAQGIEATRAELYVDDQRVAADEFAPFELDWDTRGFDDGEHRVTARVYTTGGEHVDGATRVIIDNTAPSAGTLPASAYGGQPYIVPATDNFKVARVEVARDMSGEAPTVMIQAPFGFVWRWGCGTTTIHVRVIDAAGGESTSTATVSATDANDRDCDGFESVASGGNDCNDGDPNAHPGAKEPPEGFDLNCDGSVASLDGIDSDGDGVPSIADGGTDCDDTNPAVHGNYYHYDRIPLTSGGLPVTWSPGEAVVAQSFADWAVYIDRGGVIQQYEVSTFSGGTAVRQVATGANPQSVAASYGLVAFGRGSDVVIMEERLSDGAWTESGVLHAGGQVGRLHIGAESGLIYVFYQTGTDVWFATSTDLTTWSTEHIVDLHEALVENPSGFAYAGQASVMLHTAQTVWDFNRFQGTPFQGTQVAPLNQPPTAVTDDERMAVADGTGAAVYVPFSTTPVLRTSKPIAAMSSFGTTMFVQFTDGTVDAFTRTGNPTVPYRHAQSVPEIGPFDIQVVSDGVMAGNGVLYVPGASSVYAPADPPGDHIDANCDESD